ncbi:MAG TPA: NAD-dependent epimerase/dehydratase family protein [Candidatus Krumholzibacteriaceae bacterium]|nr:NAD-dependent epimerase/dehydratase family protein [Candidatus Krumholzibacteriaceae bacterium]
MRVAVTGGAGYIGSTLVTMLLSRGDEVVSVDNESIGDYNHLKQHEYGKKAECVVGDIRDLDLLVEEWEGCDAVAHLAALPGLVRCNEHPKEAVSVNVYGTYRVMEAARRLDVGRVVFCSSASTYGVPVEMPVTEDHPQRPLNLYGVTKVAGEQIVNTYWDNYGIETVNLRFGNIYGVGVFTRWDTVIPKFVNQGMSGESLTVYGDGEYSRDFVHVQDISEAMTLSLTNEGIGGETFNVGGETLTINRIADIVKEEIAAETGGEAEAVNTAPRPGETKKFSYDLTKIRGVLGFENRWTVREGVKQLIKYWAQQR